MHPEEATAVTPFQTLWNESRSTPDEVARLGDHCTALVLRSKLRQMIVAEMIAAALDPEAEVNQLFLGAIVKELTGMCRVELGADGVARVWSAGDHAEEFIKHRVAYIACGRRRSLGQSPRPIAEGGGDDA